MSNAMLHWLPFSYSKSSPAPHNYCSTDPYPPMKKPIVKSSEHSLSGLIDPTPLTTMGFYRVPKAHESMLYGYGHGVQPLPVHVNRPVNGRSIQEVNNLDFSNYYNCRK